MAERSGASGSGDSERAPETEPMDTSDNMASASSAGPSPDDVCKLLESVQGKWQEVATRTGFSEEELERVIEGCGEKESGEWLQMVVSQWFERGSVSWEQVTQLLREMGLDEKTSELAAQKDVTMETAESKEKEQEKVPPFTVQKAECHAALQQNLKKGDTWYLVDMRWMKQWKKYVGYDQWDQSLAGQETANPGPVDNSNLFKDKSPGQLKEHLMEELDYYLLPEAAWNKLSSWYGLGAGSCPLARRVVEHGMYMKHCKVEVYLMEFKLSIHPHYDKIVTKSFSKGDTVGDLEKSMRHIFEVPEATECRVWHRYLTNSYELLSTSSQSLQDAGLYSGQTLVLECRKEDGTWPRNTHTAPSSQHPTRSTDEQFTSSPGATPTNSNKPKSGSSSNYGSGSYYGSSSFSGKPLSPGLCGLSNLGNTCFMNSALQCLSNTTILTRYFVGTQSGYKPYKKHINKENPLGMGGAIAEAYGALLEDMWSGKLNCVAPRQFKTQVGRYAPQFVGYAQHDSQELLAFLLDGLHEDLNLVRKKPYVDMTVETEGREDKEIAEETWLKYLERNQSVIVRSFQGQLKSTLVCPNCSKLSKTFDPFMFLSLPLPMKKVRTIMVTLIRAHPQDVPVMYKLRVPKRGIVADLKSELQKLSDVAASQMVVMDVYNCRFHRMYNDKDSLNLILDRDDIFVYELPPDQTDFIHVCIYSREETVKDVRYSSSSYTQRYHQLFGIPFIVSIPKECSYEKVYETILEKGSRFMKTWTQVKNEALAQDQREVPEGEEDQQNSNGSNEEEKEQHSEGSDGGSQQPSGEVQDEGDKNDNTEENSECNEVEIEKERPQEDENNTTEEAHKDGDDVEMKDVDEEKSDNSERPLFKVVVVNSYGSQEVQQLEPLKTYTFAKSLYLACDWSSEVKEKCYDMERAQEVVKHESCTVDEVTKKNIHLMDCLQLFTQTEVLSKDDAWYCPRCKDFVQATKKFDLWKTPDVLVIHLKRFSYDRYWRDKLDVLVDFPLKGFDLSEFVQCPGEPQPIYDLYAISNHFGGMGGGHYTAYAKYKDSDSWYNFDDSHVSQAAKDRLVSPSAYVLFYERRVEGRRPHQTLDRSLSQSFAEEKKLLSNKYNRDPGSTVPEETVEDVEDEVENGGDDVSAGDVFENNVSNELEQPD